jgi:hypothetical protein
MSKGDRDTIATLIRRHEKDAKSDARRIAAERLADIEAKLSATFDADDDRWNAMIAKASAVVTDANAEPVRLCIADGIPEKFAPMLRLDWIRRGENSYAGRRAELRVAALEATAKAEIERRSVAAQTTLQSGGLSSDAARQALAEMPTAEALLPEVSVEELRVLAERDARQHEANRETFTASLLAGFRQL